MWKRCIILYLAGMLFSITIIGLIVFMLPKFNDSQNEPSLTSDTDYWPGIFEKHRTEIKMLEDYYNRIENWDFSCVYFWSEGKHTYQCYSSYLDKEYNTDKDYVPKEFLEFSLKSEDFPEEGCRVVLQGNYWECQKLSLNVKIVNASSDSRILIVDIPLYTDQEAYYLYSPNGFPTVEEGRYESTTIKYLDNGWYYIFTEPSGEVYY